jgi:hypothetical protein
MADAPGRRTRPRSFPDDIDAVLVLWSERLAYDLLRHILKQCPAPSVRHFQLGIDQFGVFVRHSGHAEVRHAVVRGRDVASDAGLAIEMPVGRSSFRF